MFANCKKLLTLVLALCAVAALGSSAAWATGGNTPDEEIVVEGTRDSSHDRNQAAQDANQYRDNTAPVPANNKPSEPGIELPKGPQNKGDDTPEDDYPCKKEWERYLKAAESFKAALDTERKNGGWPLVRTWNEKKRQWESKDGSFSGAYWTDESGSKTLNFSPTIFETVVTIGPTNRVYTTLTSLASGRAMAYERWENCVENYDY